MHGSLLLHPKIGYSKRQKRKDVTYRRIVVSYRPQKSEPNRTRLTVGRDRVNYPFETSTPTADLLTIKILWNSVLSTPKAKFIYMDVAKFYLGTSMEPPEFMRLPIKVILQEITDRYKLNSIVESKRVCMGYPKQVSWQTNCSAKDWKQVDTNSASSPLGCGVM